MPRTLVVLLVLVAAGCAASGASSRQSPDRSRPITLYLPGNATGNLLTAPPTLQLVAQTRCRPQEPCDQFTLAFRNPGASDLFLNYAPVTAEVDGETLSWPEITADPQQRPRAVRGTFLLLGVNAEAFRKLATARTVLFRFGTTDITVDYERRAPFRQLLEKMDAAR